MKKTNVLFSFLMKRKALITSSALVLAFFFAGTYAASAQQMTTKNATPLQLIQQELADLQASLATLPAVHEKRTFYNTYVTYLQAIINNLNSGMSYHAAIAGNRHLRPYWLNSVPGSDPSPVAAPVGIKTSPRLATSGPVVKN
jgi:hypothetical protein